MANAKPRRRIRDDVSSWVLTSLAISLVFHVLLVHYLGGLRVFDVEVFREAVTDWFSIDEGLLEQSQPDISPITTTEPSEATDPTEVKPEPVPMAAPTEPIGAFDNGPDEPIRPPARGPDVTRPPDSKVAVVSYKGPSVQIDQTDAALGREAPVGTLPANGTGTASKGTRTVMGGSPGLPPPPPVGLNLNDVSPERPATATHAGGLAPPTIKPSATRAVLATAPPTGIAIPLEDVVTGKQTAIPKVIVGPPPEDAKDEEPVPVIELADEVAVNFTMYAEPGESQAYFRLEIAVSKRDRLPVIPKDVIFIADVSLSMRAQEIHITRDAVLGYLRTLRRTDRFNVVVFSEEPRKLFPDFVQPTAERINAVTGFLDRIPGQVKTDLYRVLKAVVRDVASQSIRNRPTNIFFVSDGRSTSGIRDARRIVNEIGAYSRPNFAIFPFDAGRRGDRYLLDLLAYRSRGSFACCDELDAAPKAEAALFTAYDNPVLMGLRLDYTNLDVAETYPAFLPNLYADRPIVIYGRCTPGQDVNIRLQGKNPYARRALRYHHTPGAPDPTRRDIAREWAARKIHHIVSDMARVGETAALKAQIKQIGEKFNVRTPYGR